MTVSDEVAVSAALVNPAFVEMAKELNCSVEQASYCTTVFLLFVGITPLLLAPFANVYGRRILYIASTSEFPVLIGLTLRTDFYYHRYRG